MTIIITSLQINIKLKSEMPVQIDGEPWMQPPGNVIVRPILTQVFTENCVKNAVKDYRLGKMKGL